MALNLSTLTSPATSGDVLAEVLTTADFLEPVPVLRNLARGSNKGGDAEQAVALNQPKALPLIDGDGYLYCSGINGNYANTPDDSSLDITGDLVIDVDVTMKSWTPTSNSSFCGKYQSIGDQRSFRFLLRPDKRLQLYFSDDGTGAGLTGAAFSTEVPFADGQRGQVRVSFDSSTGIAQFFTSIDKGATWTQLGPDRSTGKFAIYGGTAEVYVGAYSQNSELLPNAGIHSVKLYDSVTPSSSSLRFNCDFTSTNVRHNDTKFKCATGQVVTINQSGNDPATIIKKPVLRFDGANDFMNGLLNQTITDGYMFAAFSVLGDGGEQYGRVFSVNSTGQADNNNPTGYIFSLRSPPPTNDLSYYYDTSYKGHHIGLFDDANGDILHESKAGNASQLSRVNNADIQTTSLDISSLSAEEFNICADDAGAANTAIDLEYLALFPATITDAQADAVRNYINKRNNVFDLKDGFGYYFYNPQDLSSGAVTSWNGRIVGSDNGDTDKLATQTDANDQPVGDGYVVTFADNSDHLDIPSTTQAGWQVVGTSLGTFAYRVNANAVTEINLLGNLGNASYRQTGDLYGVILLPESATGADIEAARKLLIDRGAADASTIISAGAAWFRRYDIVEFKNAEFPDALTLGFAFEEATNLSKISTVNAPICPNFSSAWKGTTALTSFPAGAKLGTDAENVNFTSAWQSSGLTSFSTPLPTATTLTQSFQACSSLTQFTSNLSSALTLVRTWRNSGLTSFSVELPSARFISQAWEGCSDLVDFSAEVFDNWNPSSITSEVFNLTWSGCTSLTAQSVENILTSIDASGKYATTNGASGGSALADAGIDIDYNVATGSLSVATTAAIDSLSGKGWQVYINGELVIPNILDLEPAAAYSLRSFDADADPNVVNVRRSSDGATSDFTASEVSDGTLTSWVGGSNLITYSNAFSSQWTKTTSSTLTGGQAGYDGTNDATEFYDSKSNSFYGMFQQFLTLGIDGQITASIYVKAGTVSTGQFDVYYNGGYTVAVSFDLLNGTVESGILGGATHIPDAVGIDDVGNGWYRINLTNDNGSTDIQYLRMGLSSAGTIFIQDAQVVYGDTVTSYVESTSSPAGNGHVTTWYDQSSNGRDSSQSTASAQPKIVDGGTLVTEGGLAALDFDSVSNLDFAYLSLSNNFTIFTVLNPSDNARTLSLDGSGAPRIDFENAAPDAVEIVSNGFSSANKFDLANSDVVDNQILFSLINNSSNISVFQNGIASSENPLLVSGNFTFGQIGGSLEQVHQEMVFFNTDQSANRTGIENNINDHFDIYS
jgi:hypothetical protein